MKRKTEELTGKTPRKRRKETSKCEEWVEKGDT